MNQPVILFVSHRDENCGVYQFGKNVAKALERSSRYTYRALPCEGREVLLDTIRSIQPQAVIYNYHPSTLAWLSISTTKQVSVPQLGVIHEVTQQVADTADGTLFDFHIAPDPTLLLRNPRVFKTGRWIPHYVTRSAPSEIPTIGSFGFATSGKGFVNLVDLVQQEFDEARIRLNIPPARFGDATGERAREVARACRSRLHKAQITLEVSHDFLDHERLLDFLASNSLNAFLYDDVRGRGISSVTDYALAVDRPIAVSSSSMFRHMHDLTPSIVVGKRSLSEIAAAGTAPLAKLKHEWTEENLVWEYDRIVDAALARFSDYRPASGVRAHPMYRAATATAFAGAKKAVSYGARRAMPALTRLAPELDERAAAFAERAVRSLLRRAGHFGSATANASDWIPNATAQNTLPLRGTLEAYRPSSEFVPSFNRILDDDARRSYRAAIEYLECAAPEVIARKIARANVQQAFVLDSVTRFAGPPGKGKLLCVGSYEDTASIALVRGGYDVEEVDPVLNYDLTTFLTKPSTRAASFDVVFSTSVIEHVADDAEFVRAIAHLLKPNGVAILTCDFRDDFQPGDAMPKEDRRLYTARDLSGRILEMMPACQLVDAPQWQGIAPDFAYGGTRYSFATFVVRKIAA